MTTQLQTTSRPWVNKSKQILFVFKTLQKKLSSSSTYHLLKVVAATFLPSITYSLQMLNTKNSTTLNLIQPRLFKKLFTIPSHISQVQIRLEYGLKKQILARKGDLAKTTRE